MNFYTIYREIPISGHKNFFNLLVALVHAFKTHHAYENVMFLKVEEWSYAIHRISCATKCLLDKRFCFWYFVETNFCDC